MKFEKYESPEIEVIKIEVEGSFLASSSSDFTNPDKPGFGKDDEDYEGDF